MEFESDEFWGGLSKDELDFTGACVTELEKYPQAKSILDHARKRGSLPKHIQERGSPSDDNFSDLFELRLAFELQMAGHRWEYEFPGGVGASTIDFCIHGSQDWLVELVSARTTEAVRSSTKVNEIHNGIKTYCHVLISGASDVRNTEEHEMIAVSRKILQKVAKDGKPTKFSETSQRIHMIIVDMRGYLGGGGGDVNDYIQIALGPDFQKAEYPCCHHPETHEPIRGLFDEKNPLQDARYCRERIHFIGFVEETEYHSREIPESLLLFNNPYLFRTREEIENTWAKGPFSTSRIFPCLLGKKTLPGNQEDE